MSSKLYLHESSLSVISSIFVDHLPNDSRIKCVSDYPISFHMWCRHRAVRAHVRFRPFQLTGPIIDRQKLSLEKIESRTHIRYRYYPSTRTTFVPIKLFVHIFIVFCHGFVFYFCHRRRRAVRYPTQ